MTCAVTLCSTFCGIAETVATLKGARFWLSVKRKTLFTAKFLQSLIGLKKIQAMKAIAFHNWQALKGDISVPAHTSIVFDAQIFTDCLRCAINNHANVGRISHLEYSTTKLVRGLSFGQLGLLKVNDKTCTSV
jgi:hypothetical protein